MATQITHTLARPSFFEGSTMSLSTTALSTTAIGVGFDTARYGHHVSFLRDDLQPACPPFEFVESRQGYDRLLQQLRQFHEGSPGVHFHMRLDAAGQYACNLAAFLRGLPFTKTITVGEPARNSMAGECGQPLEAAQGFVAKSA